jgi:four helix bundle protein
VHDFRKLKVWQKAHELTLAVYKATTKFPREEIYGLTSQLRRASASIPANLAEGCGRSGDVELSRFCRIAWGSASEAEYHLLLARDLKFIKPEEHQALTAQLDEVQRMLTSFLDRLKSRSSYLAARGCSAQSSKLSYCVLAASQYPGRV